MNSKININDFGAIADGTSHPLSETYGTLAAAQAVYPAALALSDEKDWCAWQAAVNYAYSRDDALNVNSFNWGHGRFAADGRYIVNRTVTFPLVGARVEGQLSATRFNAFSQTSIQYNGPNGTLDEPVYIFDFLGFDEFGNAPAGYKRASTALSGGVVPQVRHITFSGKGGDIKANAVDISGFVSGIRIRKATFATVEFCNFGGTLWDGIKFTDAQLFPTVRHNDFYGVHRDAIAFDRAGAFSTTIRVGPKNEFGLVGRYALLLDLFGSTAAGVVTDDNDYEHAFPESFFVKHPEWFVQGVVSGVCMIAAGDISWTGNRFESVSLQPGYWADLHLAKSNDFSLRDGRMNALALTAIPLSIGRTADLTVYLAAKGHTDITDLRNYHLGDSSGSGGECQGLYIDKPRGLTSLLVADGRGLSTTAMHSISNVGLNYLSMPVQNGPAGNRIVQPRATAITSLITEPINVNLREAGLTSKNRSIRAGFYDTHVLHGDYTIKTPYNAWTASTTMSPFTAGANFLAPFRKPTVAHENWFFYQAIVGGVTGAVEPTWPAALNATAVDGTVTWRCAGTVGFTSELNVHEWAEGGSRRRSGTAVPTSGRWDKGSIIWNTAAVAGQPIGWYCTVTGVPGTWLPLQSL